MASKTFSLNRFFRYTIVFTLGIAACAYLIDGINITSGALGHPLITALVAGLVFTMITLIVKPIIHIIALPFSIITFGIFAVIINVLLFWFISPLVDGVSILGFFDALWGAIIMSIVGWLGMKVF
ncbi:MAG: putative membrane protein [Flavobacteriaceae bacterium]|jgi:putative membrane protein